MFVPHQGLTALGACIPPQMRDRGTPPSRAQGRAVQANSKGACSAPVMNSVSDSGSRATSLCVRRYNASGRGNSRDFWCSATSRGMCSGSDCPSMAVALWQTALPRSDMNLRLIPARRPCTFSPKFRSYSDLASQTMSPGRMTDRQGPVSCVTAYRHGSLHSCPSCPCLSLHTAQLRPSPFPGPLEGRWRVFAAPGVDPPMPTALRLQAAVALFPVFATDCPGSLEIVPLH